MTTDNFISSGAGMIFISFTNVECIMKASLCPSKETTGLISIESSMYIVDTTYSKSMRAVLRTVKSGGVSGRSAN